MVDIFSGASPVTSRLGRDAMIDIPALHDPDVNEFIKRIVAYLRDPKFDVESAIKSATVAKEKITKEFFPFTAEAVEALKSKTHLLTPREITLQMTRALGRAHRLGLRAITTECFK
jgi:hypothetical protein